MITPDMINGAFEAFAGAMIGLHCRRVWIDKKVRGASIVATLFFTAWGFWNLFYYPNLGQTFSFYGGLVVVAANAVWLALMWYYRDRSVLVATFNRGSREDAVQAHQAAGGKVRGKIIRETRCFE